MDMPVEDLGISFALSFGLVFTIHESAELVHLGMDRFECGVLVEEFLKFALLSWCKFRRSFAHGGEPSAMVLEFRSHRSGQSHEVVVDDPYYMKAIGHDSGIREVATDHVSVWTREVDRDHFHFVTPSQRAEIGRKIGKASSWSEVENPMVFEIAERGAESLPLVQGMLINPEVLRAFQRESFIGFTTCKLGVDSTHCG